MFSGRAAGRLLVLTVLFAGVMLVGPGCGPHSKNSLRDFLFPESASEQTAEKQKSVQEVETKAGEGEVGDTAEINYLLVSHKPYIERKCDECHQGASAFTTSIYGDHWDGIFRTGGGKPGPLVLPVKKLCLKCHTDLSVEWAEKRGLALHTTAREGECAKCHVPHQGRHPHRLIADKDQLCQMCHNAGEKPGIPKCVRELQATGHCMSCHNAHLGVDESLLAEDYKEPEHTVPPEGEPHGDNLSPVDAEAQQ